MARPLPRLPERIDTPRLVLRWPRFEDAPSLVPLLDDWEVARWLANVPFPYAATDAQGWVRTALSCRRSGEVLVAVVVERDGDRIIGGAELNLERREAGYWIGRPYQRRGYGRETLEALLALAFGRMALPELIAVTLPDNRPSRSLLLAAGFELRGIELFDFGLRGGDLPSCIHILTAERWLARGEEAAS